MNLYTAHPKQTKSHKCAAVSQTNKTVFNSC